ncbi:BRCA2-interacting transcriptional repressor EMSY-like [Ruditapes philippinarum]|uniref:BRCA2-interacting transcriptional repressor EMSY-like n=1 Tax=Ruditapes philippinarum TaxID=129788 RepID=UPI00295BF336|nr:BRCA2-interacting transcriptional repressor EMSY-like [Ruditapes philippinarum]
MWPELLDMTHEESKRILRRVELEAYSSIVSAFRAQGDLNKEKKKILHDLQQFLSISTERHRAEVRRAVNDEKLATIADNMSPSNTTQEWLIEGRRLVPLMPRLVPQTAFTVTANQVANMQAEKNASLPSPSQTGIRENIAAASSMSSPPSTPWTSRPSSPTSNVVVLPSGMSIHIKGGLNTEEDDDVQIRKRRRSTSTESMFSPTGTSVPQVTYTTTMSNTSAISPKKITISKSPQAQPRVVASSSQTQKVILVSSQGHSPQVTVAQKTTMPMGRSTVSTGTSTTNLPKSVILPLSSSIATGTNTGNISATAPYFTNTTSTVVTPLTSTGVGTSTTAFLTPTITASRPRFKTVPRQKLMQVPSPRPGMVIPMSPQPVQPSPQTIQGIKPGPKPTIQIRQEGGMKIITQSVGSGTSKILPKPSGTPVVVVSAGSSTQSSVAMVSRTGSSLTAGTKVLNIQTQGGKIITAPRGSSVVTVNPKTLHLTAVKNAAGISGAKPNVIVVQKTQPRRPGVPVTPGTSTGGKQTTAVISSPFEKELVSFLQKQDPTKQYVVTTTTANIGRSTDTQRKVIVTTSGHGDLAKQISQSLQKSKSDTSQPSSNILQDLITAAGIVPDGNQDNQSGEVTLNLDEAQLAALTSVAQDSTQTKVTTSMPNNEWFEYDVTDEQGNTYTHTAESADTAAAIQSLLDMQANQTAAKPKVTVQRSSSVDLSQLSDHLNQQQFYTIEQAMSMLNQSEKDTATSYIQSEAQNVVAGLDDSGDEILTAVPLSLHQDIQTSTVTTASQGKTQEPGGGDLDPQTGMFYVQKGGTISGIKIADGQQVIVSGDGDAKKYDLLSSSLAQAQIDLDPFQFIDDGNQGNKTVESSSSAPVLNEVLTTETVSTESNVGSSLLGSSSDSMLIQKVVGTSPITTSTPAIRIQPSTFIPIQDVIKSSTVKTSTIGITSTKPVSIIHQSNTTDTQIEGFQSLDASALPGRRKRKVLSGEEIASSPPAGSGAPGGWVRAALGVLNKVSKYRGLNRDKNDLNAATWFTQPVDPADAPDYYTIVENPMDFGTIKKKLESCRYDEFEDFHSDMMLVKDNCYLYNPEQSLVRKDCDEVFSFYMSEHEKLMEKWQKTHIGSPVSKKPRTDRSPIRP